MLDLGFLWVFINGERQAWHDKLAKTFVVRTDIKGALIPVDSEGSVTTGQKLTFAVMFLFATLPIIFLFVYIFLMQPFQIVGNAMAPGYVDGQYHIVNKTAYRVSGPIRGDVIVFRSPRNPESNLIRRVIGIPNDTISIRNGKIYLNGRLPDERTYIENGVQTHGGVFLGERQVIAVPDNNYFVLGDNRLHGSDSREWGFVPKENITGSLAFCYYKCSLSGPNR